VKVSDFVLKPGAFLPENTLYLYYRNHSFNDDYGHNCRLL